jgi:hypothetical protein
VTDPPMTGQITRADDHSILVGSSVVSSRLLEEAVAFIRSEALYASAVGAPTEYLLALSALNYVQSRISPYRYHELPVTERPAGPEQALAAQAGICGHQVSVFLEIGSRLGLVVRPIEVYFRSTNGRESHLGAEVFWHGAWHYFDVTWGTFFRERGAESSALLSFHEVAARPDRGRLAITNGANLIFQAYMHAELEPFLYLDETGSRIVMVDGRGTVEPEAEHRGREVVYSLAGMPNFVGIARGYGGRLGDVKLRFSLPATTKRLSVSVSGSECGPGDLRLDSDDWKRRVALASIARRGDFSLPVPKGGGPVTMSVLPEATGMVCYLVLAGMRAA